MDMETRIQRIDRQEIEKNTKFEKWLGSDVEFINLSYRGRQLLKDYVEGLHNDIANLKASIVSFEET